MNRNRMMIDTFYGNIYTLQYLHISIMWNNRKNFMYEIYRNFYLWLTQGENL